MPPSAPSAEGDAQPLFTLVPLGGRLEAEVKIEAKDIGFIQLGDPVEVKLDAYAFIQHGTAKGEIKTISEGSFTDGDNQLMRPLISRRSYLQRRAAA